MIKRQLTFCHRLGGLVDLPLFVPSFSSKGFPFFTKKQGHRKHTYSETTRALEALGSYINESLLISAYDLHHKHFRRPEKYFRDTALVFLDSGGYELNPDFDSAEPKMTPTRQLPFSAEDYDKVLARLHEKHSGIPFVIANFDWEARHKSFEIQIRDARRLFNQFPDWSNNFILKPQSPSGSIIDVDELTPHLAELRSFDIVGITEKELGKNLIDRLRRLAKLRVEISKRNVTAPIHVWGGLDPLVTPLYFFAGADIFDGVSSLRYAFHAGLAVNRESYPILEGNITTPHDHAIIMSLNHNLISLQGLANSLRAFGSAESLNFEMFDHNRDIFEKAFRTMTAKVPELKELY